jgi:hypothetical protein
LLAHLVLGNADKFRRLIGPGVPKQLRRLLIVLAGDDLVDLLLQVTVGRQHVQPPVQVVVEEEHAELQFQAGLRPQAVRNRFVGEEQPLRIALRDEEARRLVGKVADDDGDRGAIARAGDVDAHRAAGCPVAAERDARLAADLGERAVLPVVKDEVLHRVVGHDQVLPAVAVQVEGDHAQRLAGGDFFLGPLAVENLDAGRLRDIAELAFAVVAIEVAQRALKAERRPIGPLVAGQRESLGHVDLARPLHIVADEQVQPTVAVVVEPGAAGAPSVFCSGDTRGIGHIDELALLVAQQPVFADGGEEQIAPAVAVIVAHRSAHAVERDG